MAKNKTTKIQDPRRAQHVRTMTAGVFISLISILMLLNKTVIEGTVLLVIGVGVFEVGRRKLD